MDGLQETRRIHLGGGNIAGKIFRHGDVIVEKIEKIPVKAKETNDNVLALGEITGHKHIIRGATVLQQAEKKFLLVEKTATLTHEEHKAIQLPRGKYSVTIQREYDPVAERKVQD